MSRTPIENAKVSKRWRVLLLLLSALALVVVLAFAFPVASTDKEDHRPLLASAEIANGDFRDGLEHWHTKNISAVPGSETTHSGAPLTFARLSKPPGWKIRATMLQEGATVDVNGVTLTTSPRPK